MKVYTIVISILFGILMYYTHTLRSTAEAADEKILYAMQGSYFAGCMSVISNPDLQPILLEVCKTHTTAFMQGK